MEFGVRSASDKVSPPAPPFRTSFLGAHHARNAALAMQTVGDFLGRCVSSAGLVPADPQGRVRLPANLIANAPQGCARAFMPGRFQCVQLPGVEGPLILDVGHNPEALHCTLEVAQKVLSAPPIIVLGMLRDKRFDGVLQQMTPLAQRLILTAPHVKRAWDLSATAATLQKAAARFPVSVCPDPLEALQQALGSAPVLVLGSHYLIGELLPSIAARCACSVESLLRPPALPSGAAR